MGLVKRGDAPPPTEQRHETRDPEGLRRALVAAAPGERRWAARDLALVAGSEALLGERLAVEPEPDVRAAIVSALVSLGTADAVAAFLPLLRTEEPELRNAAIEGLQEITTGVAEALRPLLQDPDDDVRIFCVNILAGVRDQAAEQVLLDVLRQDAHINVIAAAADALAEIGSPEAVPLLEAAAERHAAVKYLAFALRTAARRIGGDL